MRCNAGQDPCTTGKKFKLSTVPVTPEDLELVKKAVRDISFPAWAEVCDKVNPGCSADVEEDGRSDDRTEVSAPGTRGGGCRRRAADAPMQRHRDRSSPGLFGTSFSRCRSPSPSRRSRARSSTSRCRAWTSSAATPSPSAPRSRSRSRWSARTTSASTSSTICCRARLRHAAELAGDRRLAACAVLSCWSLRVLRETLSTTAAPRRHRGRRR